MNSHVLRQCRPLAVILPQTSIHADIIRTKNKMTKKSITLIAIWVIYCFTEYFILPYFIQPFSWLLVCIILLGLLIWRIIKTINLRKPLNVKGVLNISIPLTLFLLTFYKFNRIPNSIIEKIDWVISYNTRTKIVADVEIGRLKANSEMNNGICKLPFSFPIISNGGDDIWIYQIEKTKTIKFWVSRGFFESPQTYFIYTNDTATKNHYQELIKTEPKSNWQLGENWYRIMERD